MKQILNKVVQFRQVHLRRVITKIKDVIFLVMYVVVRDLVSIAVVRVVLVQEIPFAYVLVVLVREYANTAIT